MATVLVVDDEFGVAEVLEAVLGDAGYGVLTAVNGRQALERLGTSRPDLVLLDYMMPVVDGAGVLAAMAADPGLATIPVVMMSSLSEDVVAQRCSGYRGFLRKPFRTVALLQMIQKLLAARTSAREPPA